MAAAQKQPDVPAAPQDAPTATALPLSDLPAVAVAAVAAVPAVVPAAAATAVPDALGIPLAAAVAPPGVADVMD